MPENKGKVAIAMSGGVDSTIAAYLLLQENYEVMGVSLKLFDSQNMEDAEEISRELNIPLRVIDCREYFKEQVIEYFCSEHEKCRTPNPCIVCNSKIKFGFLLDKAKSLGADYIATGHYAKTGYDKMERRYFLEKGKDRKKDQSYFLFNLSQQQLKHTLFPLGCYTKEEVLQLSKELGFGVHEKSSSQEICFVEDSDYNEFLISRCKNVKRHPGPIISKKGEVLGEHQGIAFYTIGQRKGLGPHRKPMYVIGIDKKNDTIIIGEEKELYKNELMAKNLNWIGIKNFKKPLQVKAKIRYKHKESEAVISSEGKNLVKVEFSQPQRAITPGQAVVFYDGDEVLGGGWIK
jgi:tRNA-specific 2-thiouridylase